MSEGEGFGGGQAIHKPVKFDRLQAYRELKALRDAPKKISPLVPRLTSTLFQAEKVTDAFVATRKHARETMEQFLVQQQDAEELFNYTEVKDSSDFGPYKAARVDNPIADFIEISKEYDKVKQMREVGAITLVDPDAMAESSFAPSVVVDQDMTNEDSMGQDTCDPLLYERAKLSCAGLDKGLVTCIADICLTGDDGFVGITQAAEEAMMKNAIKVAQTNVDLGELINRALVAKMTESFAAAGVECADTGDGLEPWNVAPYDRLVPAWTTDIYNEVRTMILENEANAEAASANTTNVTRARV